MNQVYLTIFFTIASAAAYSQTAELVTEEKSSAWVRVAVPVRAAVASPSPRNTTAPATRARTGSNTPAPRAAAPPKKTETFKKTNEKVRRFKKSQP